MTDNLFDEKIYESLRMYRREKLEEEYTTRNSSPAPKPKGSWNPGWHPSKEDISEMQKVLTQIHNDFKLGDALGRLTFARNQYDPKILLEKVLENEGKPVVMSLTLRNEFSGKRGPESHFTAEVLQVDLNHQLNMGRLSLDKKVNRYDIQIGGGKYSSQALYKNLSEVTGTILNVFYTPVNITDTLFQSGYTPDYIMKSLNDEVQKILDAQKIQEEPVNK